MAAVKPIESQMMKTTEDETGVQGYASPPCFMHEIDPVYAGLPMKADPLNKEGLARWRNSERERLLDDRLTVDADTRRDWARSIARTLDQLIGDPSGLAISGYWPFRGEPDLRPWLSSVRSRGGYIGLPVVLEKAAPLEFRLWRHDDQLTRGIWNIPVPTGSEEIVPDIVIAPLVGFDSGGYRLGYGGGFFDRTLAALSRRRQVIGVGYAMAAIPTIYPQPYDIPMDLIVTESEIMTPRIDAGPYAVDLDR